MPLYTKYNTNILFVHIPKTAGSSITTAFRNAGFTATYINEPAKTGAPDIKPCNPQHYHKELCQQHILNNVTPDFCFTITRNPLQRLISEYMWRHTHTKEYVAVNGYTKEFFSAFQNWACQQFDQYEKNNYHADNHIRPQTEFILDNCKIYDINNLSALQQDLQPYVNLQIGKENTTAQTKPNTILNIHKNFVDKFMEIYNNDYEVFNYDKQF